MTDLICYKQNPVWTAVSLPDAFKQAHNTQAGTWAKLTVLSGQLHFSLLTETGQVITRFILTPEQQLPLITPQQWHRIDAISADAQCQLDFYCQADDYYAKKYALTPAHSEVVAARQFISAGQVLDLGCGNGRNSLYLNQHGFSVMGVDKNTLSLTNLNTIIADEQLTHLITQPVDLDVYSISGLYDLIISTVVMMFLKPTTVARLIPDMQAHTRVGGLNLIVSAMSTDDYPCPLPFSFTFKKGELANYYKRWQHLKYNENIGELHKTDSQGNRIKLRFATLLARKVV